MTLTQDQRATLEEEDRRNGSRPLEAPSWPDPLRPAAYHGLAGRITRAIEPHSEADPTAILAQVLAAFGNAAGHGPGFEVEADFHPTNLFVVHVGTTSKGRKGSSWGHARRVVEMADPTWGDRVVSGLSSGEGLIHAVRDPQSSRRRARTKEERERADEDGYIEEVVDEGVEDKRLCAVEPEFASALRVMGRDGSTLSAVERQAWDGLPLRTLTRNSPLCATGAHVTIIGHISREELRRELSQTDGASGFGNRHLFVCVKRSKVLPEGGRLTDDDLRPLANELATALTFARRSGALARDAAARELWADVYPKLSEGAPGMLGAVTSRGEAQVMRLAVLYALLDRQEVIRVEHLNAALALWDYCAASCRYIFGDALGDPTADEILTQLRRNPEGLRRNDLREHFGRHKTSSELDRALAVLTEHGLAYSAKEETGGRPAERWRVVTAHTALTAQPLQPEAGDNESSSGGGPGGAVSAISAERPEGIEDDLRDPFADIDPDPMAPAPRTRAGS